MSSLFDPLATVTLWQGDCLTEMIRIADGSVDMVVTSPPYDNLRTYNDSLEWSFEVFKPIARDLSRVLRQCGVIVWNVADATINGSETGSSFRQALYFKDECGLNLHDTMIWRKPNPVPLTHNRYEQAFEYMFVFSKGRPKTWNPIKIPAKNAGKSNAGTIQHDSSGVRKPKNKQGVTSELKIDHNVWEFSTETKAIHPAVYPLELPIRHILSWTNPGMTVLDPFMGSGTTGVACRNTGRSFIGIEKDATYFQIAKERIGAATR